ncbi:MAG: hypothetical protein HRT74_04905 [Flavobacteriales bacterium]|nr:hypothetical protein [Flavobacteriales bacterium]
MKIRLFDQCKGITVQNEDMAQIICVKYGWNLKNKIITNRFLANDIIMDQIKNTSKSEARDWFESEFEKVGDKELMVIGYQSKPQTQQLEILEALNSIAIAKKKNLHLVYTFIYGKERTREENILKKSHEAGFTTTVIDRYLTNEEMAKLRCATDIFVHLPESDAFSNTLLEHLYAKNLVITGTWLPYGKHRAFGVCYREVEHPRDLKLEHFEEIEVSQNPERIDRMRYEEDAAGQWLEIYKQLTL